ncbi:hypothetical protein [Halorubrum sp. BV1]|uniref:DUF7311 family protein n=1 Tax=Halorubrum sp. BV1 TaxID=1498500 RepID=UPI000679CCFC|nr:hypothetical protein [Halorubrum sp. BV1]
MIRVVLTVAVAVALLAASMPALETARVTTTTERLDSEVDRIERATARVVSGSVAVTEPSLAARASVTVRAPSGVTAASIDRIALVEVAGPRPDTPVALRYRPTGGRDRYLPLRTDAVPARIDLATGVIDLRPGGESRLELRYVDDGGPTVRITRVG